MMQKYIKIWLKVLRKRLTFKLLSRILAEHLLYLALIYFFVTKNITVAVIILFAVIVVRLLIQLWLNYKRIVDSNEYNLILLKPIDPLIGLLVYNQNPADIIVLLPIVVYIKFKNYIVKNKKR